MLVKKTALGCAMLIAGLSCAHAADWSDTYVGWRYGTKFAEPYNPDDIKKNIFNLGHVSGYKYGTNFLNVDMLLSDSKDSFNNGGGAQETYVVYRHTFDFGKIAGNPDAFKFGIVRGLGFTVGFDYNTKSGDSYQSRKRMPLAGPTVMFDVPGFLNLSVLQLWESNAPRTHPSRYSYDAHPMLTLAWGIPLGSLPLTFEGFMNYIAAKGANEFGGPTKPETNFDGQIMYDASPLVGARPKTFKVGVEYQYWRNKFGNDHTGAAGNGAFAKTPMLRAEYHF
ncbi:MAG TPA: hypothetical protein PLN96_01880 [Zoogloea sp.]|uniref:hypothetical protein n=1 Tax=Zoogloea sp. TaxID=49181 RepID=UPI002BA50B73|nr:hypothetical protein [Zoogloea sp.]HMV17614.1 hypothetical protein [Rhodocyclaceae bacterium]HMV61778.1 hypothetical protein [Rhodocyclaceae bacterium]HMW51705.1 hypothetical protein [Rhodocyclaceae bacterium]HMY48401.1 hypothetical protein [Rhodocyclaceae bacterium]HMZ75588.1 hypothetical protein [Rhodocyclaceae bacterium]